jgi:hypothetical protein|tara:strand:- start:1538 stop:1984 length:447 start_codon:yes stop_codon:yes gene_type:complete
MREFNTGATRDTDEGKHDYEGFLSPLVIERYAEYMTKNRIQSDGAIRASDNWQKGMPVDAYMKSGWRHFMDWWKLYRSNVAPAEKMEDALCALMFNVMGFLHEYLQNKNAVHQIDANESKYDDPEYVPGRTPIGPSTIVVSKANKNTG